MCQKAYVLVSPDSGFSHSQLNPVFLSPLLVPELPWALLCGYKDRQAEPDVAVVRDGVMWVGSGYRPQERVARG